VLAALPGMLVFSDRLPARDTLLVLQASKEFPRISEGDLIELKDGRLCVVYTRFTSGGADDSAADLVMQTSADGGKTWSPARILLPNEGQCNVMSVTLRRLKSGVLLLFYLRKDSEADACNLFVRRSTDEFQTLGEPVRVTTLDGYHVVNNDRVLELSTGRLIVPAALHTGFDPATKKVTRFVGQGVPLVYYSDDGGQTWRRDETPIPPTSQRKLVLQEPGAVELKDGRVWMYMRTAHGSQFGCHSKDGGLHWSEPVPSALTSPCSPAVIKRCSWTGALVCVWNDYRGDHPFKPPQRTPLCLATSTDEGQTWSQSIVLEDRPTGCFCYPSLTWVKNRLLLSYTEFNCFKVISLTREQMAQQLAAAQVPKVRAPSPAGPLLPDAIDYGRSYINTRANWNSPRFWVESRLVITDPSRKATRTYFQCGSCKSENTFPPRNLFHIDNYDFLPIFGDTDCVIFRRPVNVRGEYRSVQPVAKMWGGTNPAVRTFKGKVLANVKEISAAMTAGKPLVTQTELRDEKTGYTAVIECPVKTINWNRDTGDWQVDTGPVLLPDLTVPLAQWSQKLRLAYVAFNAFDWAEFIVEEPAPVIQASKEVARVHHYMGQVQTKARNVVLSQELEFAGPNTCSP
jgi:hypothetical protein